MIEIKSRFDCKKIVTVVEGNTLANIDLSNKDLRCADFSYKDLKNTNFFSTNLKFADFSGADLSGVNFRDSNLMGAILIGSNLENTILPYSVCPEEGDFIGYKQIEKNTIVKLLITGKRTSSLVSRKCRCSECKVLEIDGDGQYSLTIKGANRVKYVVGEVVTPDSYNDDIRIECTNGIHFFMTKKEAEEFKFYQPPS